MLKAIWFFLKMGWHYDKLYILYRIAYQITTCLIPVAAAIMPKFIIDELMGQARSQQLVLYIGLLTGYTLVASSLAAFFHWEGFTRRCRVAAAFELDLNRNLAQADFENLESPDFLNMKEKANKFLTCDWHGTGYLLDLAMDILGQLVTLTGIAAIIASMNGWMILLFTALAVAGALVEGWAKRRAMALSMQAIADNRGWMYYSELFSDAQYGKEIRLQRLGDWLLKRQKNFTDRANNNTAQQNRYFMGSNLCGAGFTFIQQCAAYGYLVLQVARGVLGIGSFTMYVGAVTSFAAALRRVMDSVVEIRNYDRYYDSLEEYLNFPAKLRQGRKTVQQHKPGRIEFDHVSFRYPGAGKDTLTDICLTLESGESLAIVGENGAGKTTFVKLLCRLYEPTGGRILLDGTDIRTLDYDSYAELFSTVFQDFQLFSMTLRDNINLTHQAKDERLMEILTDLGLRARVESLPGGLDTHVHRNFDSEGFEPSGGEAQKIALARALVKNGPFVVLDEPTAALDPRAEYEIYRQFDRLIEGKSAVYISHRLSSARFCDHIAVFEGGRIVQYGNHRELMEAEGIYRELFELQAAYYRE